ncbi:unnamed protein product [Brachionus calyciflorus]|uniref:Uncharacterized protein n=1 Tax=Brachionus calyciflorus TaxID=104777 RepID=A0A814EGF7_9BILA|nr:unnamed protein product [Brachionus calyciflorus]
MEKGRINRLIIVNQEDNQIKYVCAYENLFDEIDLHHKQVGHGGIDKTFIELCYGCQQKNVKDGSKKVVVKPIVSDGFMHRGQFDLIDFQSMPDGLYKFIMHYQDHHNKLSHLCPLCSKEAR